MNVKEYKAYLKLKSTPRYHEQHEHKIQSSFFRSLALFRTRHPAIPLIHAIPNGGKRNIKTAKMLKAEGVKAGIPDVFVPCPNDEWAGLYLEFKAPGNSQTKEQLSVGESLTKQGYLVYVCYSADEALRVLGAYINVKLID